MALHEDSEAYENIMTEFNLIINRFSENKEIALLYATTVANISHDLNYYILSNAANKIEGLLDNFNNDEAIGVQYAKVLKNLSYIQIGEERTNTKSKLLNLSEKFPGNEYIKKYL